MKLIKSLNKQFTVKDPVELAFESVENSESEISRIAEYWRDMVNERPEMDEQELMAGIGDDLEQLEYSPEEINRMVPKVMRMVLGR